MDDENSSKERDATFRLFGAICCRVFLFTRRVRLHHLQGATRIVQESAHHLWSGAPEDLRYQVHIRLQRRGAGELRQHEGDSPKCCLYHGPGQRGVRTESGSLYAIHSMNVFNVTEQTVKDSEVCVYKAFSQHVLIFDFLRSIQNLNLNYAITKSKCFNCLVGKVYVFKIIPVYILFETFIFHKQLNIISLTDFN